MGWRADDADERREDARWREYLASLPPLARLRVRVNQALGIVLLLAIAAALFALLRGPR